MSKRPFPIVETTIEKIIGGGQSLGTMPDGRKLFVWGALPGETVRVQITKKKSHFCEGTAIEVMEASPQRITPHDPGSFLSTSPWQIMDFATEQHYKAALIEEAFELHDVVLPTPITLRTDHIEFNYRNKVEFSWYSRTEDDRETLDLAFFRRGSKGKIIVDGTSLVRPEINRLAQQIRDFLYDMQITARSLKTLLIRCDQQGNCVWQLYIKDMYAGFMSEREANLFSAQGGEIIYSDPRSPASRITKRLASFGDVTLQDTIFEVPFHYATEGFFQVNLPVYEMALGDMHHWVEEDGEANKTVDLYSGVGTIGLTIGGPNCTLIEIDENAVREMKRNIVRLGSTATAVQAPSEKALEHITADKMVIVDPPRAGLHRDVTEKLLAEKPARIIYLSCNPVTQARDVALLCAEETYGIRAHQGYNFFPRTPHIEHLVVLDRKK